MKKQEKVTTKKLFHPRRHPRAPLAVQDKASLWLDLYVDFATALVSREEERMYSEVTRVDVVHAAEDLANRSLDAFERRWPTAEVPGRD